MSESCLCYSPVVPGQSKLKYLQLNPAVYFSSVLEEARAVVIAGGTMQPVSDRYDIPIIISCVFFKVGEFKEQLFSAISSDRVTEFSCGEPLVPGVVPSAVCVAWSCMM